MEPAEDSEEAAVSETKEYYRQRAPEYADWSSRSGPFEGGEAPGAEWFDEAETILEALESAGPRGDVLEVACGTGVLTERIAKSARTVTALDSSREMLARNSVRMKGNEKVRYIEADFYEWKPPREYDWVTFSFWISHVPVARLNEFVDKVGRCLKDGGTLFFVDQKAEASKYESVESPGGEVVTRKLADGRRFKVVKHFYSPEEIDRAFAGVGIFTVVKETPSHFFYVEGLKGGSKRNTQT